MPFIKVYVHFVWSTRHREPFLDSRELRKEVWRHMKENAGVKDVFIDTVNGYEDHCHCLVSMNSNDSMSKVMQLIKGESSYWINKHALCRKRFAWQNEYYAVSVSASAVDKVRAYIRNQEQHHRKRSFRREFDQFVEEFGFEKFPDEADEQDILI